MAKKIYGIIGHPVAHSLSPAMHNAAFRALGMNAEYLLYDVEPGKLEGFLNNISKQGIAGLNVTIPHKIKAREYIGKYGALNEHAERLGAVNTVKVEEGGRLRGFNTDGPGFYRSLVEDLRFEPEGKTIFVLGSGGAAMAIVMYLGNGPKKIFIADIESAKAKDIENHYKKYYEGKKFEIISTGGLEKALAESDLLVNATPIGMEKDDPSPIDKKLLHTGLYVYDLVYNRPITALVKEASVAKCHATTGIGMLLSQGAIAFEIWTGTKPPVDVMRKALKTALC